MGDNVKNDLGTGTTIKVICSDIDGTLLDKHRDISQKTREVVGRLPEDMPIILASSRMPSAMTYLQEKLGKQHHPLICYNGGYVLDGEEVLDSVTIPLSICFTLVELAAGLDVHISLYAEDEWMAPAEDFWTKKEINATKVHPIIMDSISALKRWEREGKSLHKVMCMGDAQHIEKLFQSYSERFKDELHLYRSKETYIEIAPSSISKASALEKLLSYKYGFSMSEVLAFGDNYNDVALLKASGLGVAMDNAKKEVKAAADAITEDNKSDGVANFIQKIMKLVPDTLEN